MKLKALLPEVESRFKTIPAEVLTKHIAKVKADGKYKDLTTRISWDLLHATFNPNEICDWYKQYNCNDDHITTLVREAMNNVFPNVLK